MIRAVDTFDTYLLILGLLLAGGALLSGIAHRSILSLAIFFLAAGILLGNEGFGVIQLDPDSELVRRVTEMTLITILFVDGLKVESEFLRRGWHVPVRSLVIAMPLTALLIAGAAAGLFSLSLAQALLLGAILSPTDPVMTSSVISNPRIPARVRHSLNLESGFNDGLALPAVVLLAGVLQGNGQQQEWWRFLVQDLGIAIGVGISGAFVAMWILNSFKGRRLKLVERYQSLYAFGVALALYSLDRYLGGNGFIAVFLAGIVMGSQATKKNITNLPRVSQDLGEIFKLGTFVIFGSLIIFDQFLVKGILGLVFVFFVLFIARTAVLMPALIGTRLDLPERLFMSWFGPRGVACITYALLVLSLGVPGGEEIFHLAALVVFGSIILHGASDTPLANWFGRRHTTVK